LPASRTQISFLSDDRLMLKGRPVVRMKLRIEDTMAFLEKHLNTLYEREGNPFHERFHHQSLKLSELESHAETRTYAKFIIWLVKGNGRPRLAKLNPTVFNAKLGPESCCPICDKSVKTGERLAWFKATNFRLIFHSTCWAEFKEQFRAKNSAQMQL